MFLAADIFSLVFEVSAGVLVSKAGSDAEKYITAHRVSSAPSCLKVDSRLIVFPDGLSRNGPAGSHILRFYDHSASLRLQSVSIPAAK
jgi:hypothetical protein